MQSQSNYSELSFQDRVKQFAEKKWESLNERQKNFAKKAWGVITYKWRWQIALNIPYLAIFLLDKSVPAVHKFDLALVSAIASKLPVPEFLNSWLGLV